MFTTFIMIVNLYESKMIQTSYIEIFQYFIRGAMYNKAISLFFFSNIFLSSLDKGQFHYKIDTLLFFIYIAYVCICNMYESCNLLQFLIDVKMS